MTGTAIDPRVVLESVGISKRYGKVVAAEDVNLQIRSGEVMALIGDNGAGKSTLVKLLSGATKPDSGQILVRGETVSFNSPQDARNRGIEVVWQDLALASGLDVAGNIFIGREITRGRLPRLISPMNRRQMRSAAIERLERLEIEVGRVDRVQIGNLSGGQRQAVAVARGAAWAEGVLFMDEPTAALGVKQTGAVLGLATRLAELGVAVVMITHAIPHVMRIAHRVVVLRHGRVVADLPRHDATEHKLVSLIVGFEGRVAEAMASEQAN